MKVCILRRREACISCRYNETLVALFGASAETAIFYTGTYGAAAQGQPAPYTLVMQMVALAPSRYAPVRNVSRTRELRHARWAQDCNLVLYDGNAASDGYNAATAVYNSATDGAGANPCSLTVSSAAGGFLAVVGADGAVVYQEPPPVPLPPSTAPPPPTSTPAPPTSTPATTASSNGCLLAGQSLSQVGPVWPAQQL